MSFKVSGYDERYDPAAEIASVMGNKISRAESPDMHSSLAAAEYAAKLTFAVLSEMGLLPPEGINQDEFILTAFQLARQSAVL